MSATFRWLCAAPSDRACPAVRSGISIVPQSPDLFEGTIRENIDPTGVSQDADIWVALEQVRAARLDCVHGAEG